VSSFISAFFIPETNLFPFTKNLNFFSVQIPLFGIPILAEVSIFLGILAFSKSRYKYFSFI